MTWGGPRENSGRKTAWKHGETTTIRVPEALKDRVLQAARLLDEGEHQEHNREHQADAIRQARELLAHHLEEVGRKGTLKRSVIKEAIALLDSVT